MSVVLNIGG